MESRQASKVCVSCGQYLPATSKINRQQASRTEADQNGWAYEEADELVTMAMCLPCETARSQRLNRKYDAIPDSRYRPNGWRLQ